MLLSLIIHVIVKHKASMISMAMKLLLRPAPLLVKVAIAPADVVLEVETPFNIVELDSVCPADSRLVALTVGTPDDVVAGVVVVVDAGVPAEEVLDSENSKELV
jgi:hypothetical protein